MCITERGHACTYLDRDGRVVIDVSRAADYARRFPPPPPPPGFGESSRQHRTSTPAPAPDFVSKNEYTPV
ncbi:MAG: hypothetical protein LBR07_00110 [Puniceicoccales bacterium]|nr:hypothetical protein [Puniceicoccales bacterium]